MDYTRLTIGQMAKLNNISTQTLRYYDQIGLLKPRFYDEDNKYRYYTIEQCAVLDAIIHMQSLKLSLSQIKDFLKPGKHQELYDAIVAERNVITKEITQLENVRRIMDRKIRDYQKSFNLPKDGVPYIEVIPERYIYKYDTGVNYYYAENSSITYEYMLRLFKNNLIEKKLPFEYFYNVGSVMRKENFLKKDFVSTELFVFLENILPVHDYITIDGGTYLCMTCDNSENEINYINKMLKTSRENGYEIIGDYICEVVNEFYSFNSNQRNMSLKLQVPIKIL